MAKSAVETAVPRKTSGTFGDSSGDPPVVSGDHSSELPTWTIVSALPDGTTFSGVDPLIKVSNVTKGTGLLDPDNNVIPKGTKDETLGSNSWGKSVPTIESPELIKGRTDKPAVDKGTI